MVLVMVSIHPSPRKREEYEIIIKCIAANVLTCIPIKDIKYYNSFAVNCT